MALTDPSAAFAALVESATTVARKLGALGVPSTVRRPFPSERLEDAFIDGWAIASDFSQRLIRGNGGVVHREDARREVWLRRTGELVHDVAILNRDVPGEVWLTHRQTPLDAETALDWDRKVEHYDETKGDPQTHPWYELETYAWWDRSQPVTNPCEGLGWRLLGLLRMHEPGSTELPAPLNPEAPAWYEDLEAATGTASAMPPGLREALLLSTATQASAVTDAARSAQAESVRNAELAVQQAERSISTYREEVANRYKQQRSLRKRAAEEERAKEERAAQLRQEAREEFAANELRRREAHDAKTQRLRDLWEERQATQETVVEHEAGSRHEANKRLST